MAWWAMRPVTGEQIRGLVVVFGARLPRASAYEHEGKQAPKSVDNAHNRAAAIGLLDGVVGRAAGT